jgi:hypothetical protein
MKTYKVIAIDDPCHSMLFSQLAERLEYQLNDLAKEGYEVISADRKLVILRLTPQPGEAKILPDGVYVIPPGDRL